MLKAAYYIRSLSFIDFALTVRYICQQTAGTLLCCKQPFYVCFWMIDQDYEGAAMCELRTPDLECLKVSRSLGSPSLTHELHFIDTSILIARDTNKTVKLNSMNRWLKARPPCTAQLHILVAILDLLLAWTRSQSGSVMVKNVKCMSKAFVSTAAWTTFPLK